LAGWCDDAGVSRLRHSDYGRIIFCGYVILTVCPDLPVFVRKRTSSE
jgi:hypothetical protein